MKRSIHSVGRQLLPILAAGLMCTPAHAHLMKAQHGTLRLVGDNAYMVLSLPVTAFKGLDDNGDGQVTLSEFDAHRPEVAETLKKSVNLYSNDVPLKLTGLLLSASGEEHALSEPAAAGDHAFSGAVAQVVAMGRFALPEPDAALRFENTLFGMTAAERTLAFALSRKSDSKRESVTLTPENTSVNVFPPALTGLSGLRQSWYYLLPLLLAGLWVLRIGWQRSRRQQVASTGLQ